MAWLGKTTGAAAITTGVTVVGINEAEKRFDRQLPVGDITLTQAMKALGVFTGLALIGSAASSGRMGMLGEWGIPIGTGLVGGSITATIL